MSNADEIEFRTTAKATAKKVGVAPQGTLTLAAGRLSLAVRDQVDLDVAVGDITDVRVPWYMLGAGVRFTANGQKWVADFSKMTVVHSPVGTLINAAQLTGLGNWRNLAKASGATS